MLAEDHLHRLQDKVHELDINDTKQTVLLEVLAKAFDQMTKNDTKREEREAKQDQQLAVLLTHVNAMIETRKSLKNAFINAVPNSLKFILVGAVSLFIGHHY